MSIGGDGGGEARDLDARNVKGGLHVPQADLTGYHHIAGGMECEGGRVLGPLAGVLEHLLRGGGTPDVHGGSPFGDGM